MAKTRHIQKRMSQRRIKAEMLNIVEQFGVIDGVKVTLNKKAIDAALEELERLKSDLMKARKQGGFVLVQLGGDLITTYSLDSYKRLKASNDPIY